MKIHIKIVGFQDVKIDEDICLNNGIIVRDIINKFSEDNEMFRRGIERNHIVIMINGVSTGYLQGVGTSLKDGDDLLIIPMQFGG